MGRSDDTQTPNGGPASERRGDVRYAIGETGALWRGEMRSDCTVINLSATGALVETSDAPQVGDTVELRIANWGQFPARVLYRRQNRLGLAFTSRNPCESDAFTSQPDT